MYKSLCPSYMPFAPYGSKQSTPPCCVPSTACLMSTPGFLVLFIFPLSLFCPSITECQINCPLVCLPVRVVNFRPHHACQLPPLLSCCQAFSDARVLQTLTRLAPQLRLARPRLLSFRAFLTFFHLQPLPWVVW